MSNMVWDKNGQRIQNHSGLGMRSEVHIPDEKQELRNAIKLIWDRGLDTADGRDCAIIKLIRYVEKEL